MSFLKKCKKCGETKTDDLFYSHSQMSDGKFSHCKECHKKGVNARYAADIDASREREKLRSRKPERKEAAAKALILYRMRHPEKTSARRKVRYALSKGYITKQSCEECGEEKAQAHHDDYSKPLDIRWLCQRCHDRWHDEHPDIDSPDVAEIL